MMAAKIGYLPSTWRAVSSRMRFTHRDSTWEARKVSSPGRDQRTECGFELPRDEPVPRFRSRAAKAEASPGGKHAVPGWDARSSGVPPLSVPSTQQPEARASRVTMPKVSETLHRAKASRAA
jgi:hypothetical protein